MYTDRNSVGADPHVRPFTARQGLHADVGSHFVQGSKLLKFSESIFDQVSGAVTVVVLSQLPFTVVFHGIAS